MKKWISLALMVTLAFALTGPPALGARGIEAYTPILDMSAAMLNNLDLCMSLVDGAYVPYGGTFSFLDVTGPKTAKRGYQDAVNGRGAHVTGGGISHVATTLYLAVKQLAPDLLVTDKHVFSKFTGGYVADKDDAIAVDYDDGLDLRFRNNWEDMTIYMWRNDDEMYCEIVADVTGGGSAAFGEVDPPSYGYGDDAGPDTPDGVMDRRYAIPAFDYSATRASLNQDMATRTGPNTKYTEPGTFPEATSIQLYYQTEGNGVMWGLVEFEHNGELYRLYTGMKRIDASRVPTEAENYRTMTLCTDATPRYGPGKAYALQPDWLPTGGSVKVYCQENGYCMVDYEGSSQTVRGWITVESVY